MLHDAAADGGVGDLEEERPAAPGEGEGLGRYFLGGDAWGCVAGWGRVRGGVLGWVWVGWVLLW